MLVDGGNVTMVICVPSVSGALTQQVNAWVATDAHHPWRRVSCGMIPTGKGHYNAAIPAFKYSKVDRTNAIASIKSCRCGINKKSAATESCKPCPIYTTQCKCCEESWPCNALRQCVGCASLHGQRLHHVPLHWMVFKIGRNCKEPNVEDLVPMPQKRPGVVIG